MLDTITILNNENRSSHHPSHAATLRGGWLPNGALTDRYSFEIPIKAQFNEEYISPVCKFHQHFNNIN
jgi:hypothetical protein